MALAEWLIRSVPFINPPLKLSFAWRADVCRLRVLINHCIPTGQLGNRGRPARKLQQCPGASETGGLHDEKKKVANEGLAQGSMEHLCGLRVTHVTRLSE